MNEGACRVCELFICVLFCVLWYKVDVQRGVCAIWLYGVAYVMTCVYWNTSYMWRAERERAYMKLEEGENERRMIEVSSCGESTRMCD